MEHRQLLETALRPALPLLALLVLGGCAALGGQTDTPAASADEDAASVNFRLGVGYMQSGRFDQAQLKLSKAIDFDAELVEAYNALGVLFEQTGQGKLAEQNYQTAVEKNPEYVLARMNYGRLLCANGRPQEGEQQFLVVTEQADYATLEVPYTGAGVCARARSDLATADSYFRKALEANPYSAGTLLEMASLSFERKSFDEARTYLKRFHQQAGYSPATLDLGLKIADALGDSQLRSEYKRLQKVQLKPNA